MADTPEPEEQTLWELHALYEASMDENDKLQRVCDAVEVALGRIAREQYPALKRWEPDQLRRLGVVIYRHADAFAQELIRLDTTHR